jgi:excisionase family DNA binding protein
MAPHTIPTFLTETEAAEYLGISKKTLQRWRYSRSGPPYIKLKHLVRYPVEDLQSWLDRYKVSARNNDSTHNSEGASWHELHSKNLDQGNKNG